MFDSEVETVSRMEFAAQGQVGQVIETRNAICSSVEGEDEASVEDVPKHSPPPPVATRPAANMDGPFLDLQNNAETLAQCEKNGQMGPSVCVVCLGVLQGGEAGAIFGEL